jgi:antitoxin ParD1/3/4
MNVSLSPELEKLVSKKVESGMYSSASEVTRAGLRLLAEQDELKQLRFNELRNSLQIGLDQESANEVVSGPMVIKHLLKKHGK